MLLSHLPSTSDCIIHTRSWASFATHHTHTTTTTTDVYEGTFLNGRKHGRGRLQFANGDVYEGDFKNGLIDGTGEYQFVSGDVYVGDYLNGVQHGMGIVVYADGQRYEGTFANGVPHGQGTLFYFESEGVPARMLPTNAAHECSNAALRATCTQHARDRVRACVWFVPCRWHERVLRGRVSRGTRAWHRHVPLRQRRRVRGPVRLGQAARPWQIHVRTARFVGWRHGRVVL